MFWCQASRHRTCGWKRHWDRILGFSSGSSALPSVTFHYFSRPIHSLAMPYSIQNWEGKATDTPPLFERHLHTSWYHAYYVLQLVLPWSTLIINSTKNKSCRHEAQRKTIQIWELIPFIAVQCYHWYLQLHVRLYRLQILCINFLRIQVFWNVTLCC
jgi:hypothetical protein